MNLTPYWKHKHITEAVRWIQWIYITVYKADIGESVEPKLEVGYSSLSRPFSCAATHQGIIINVITPGCIILRLPLLVHQVCLPVYARDLKTLLLSCYSPRHHYHRHYPRCVSACASDLKTLLLDCYSPRHRYHRHYPRIYPFETTTNMSHF